MEYKNAWLIIAKANLHVGNENISNYGLIDKAIQRDIVTNLPCINSSSLKGAINEYTTMVCTTSITPQQRISIFGVDKNDKSKTQKGNTVFFDANILALPRPNDHTLYELATCDAVLDRFVERLSIKPHLLIKYRRFVDEPQSFIPVNNSKIFAKMTNFLSLPAIALKMVKAKISGMNKCYHAKPFWVLCFYQVKTLSPKC